MYNKEAIRNAAEWVWGDQVAATAQPEDRWILFWDRVKFKSLLDCKMALMIR